MQSAKTQDMLRVRASTKRVLVDIAVAKGWKIAEAADRAAIALAKQEQIALPQPAALPRRRARRAAA